jgi:hypothetical protein
MTTTEFPGEWIIRSSILIASGALLLWLLRVKDSSIRAAAWTVMLCGSLVIPALTLALPRTFLKAVRQAAAGVVVRPAEVPVVISAPAPVRTTSAEPPGSAFRQYSGGAAKPEPPASGRSATRSFGWERAALMFYAATCGAMLLRVCTGLLIGPLGSAQLRGMESSHPRIAYRGLLWVNAGCSRSLGW